MADGEHDLEGLDRAEESVARELMELGALMQQIERAEADLAPGFARGLRARLVLGEDLTPDPAFARTLRDRLVDGSNEGASVRRRVLTRIWPVVATVAAILVALLFGPLRPAEHPSFTAPYPSRADLLFSYPAPSIVIHRLQPVVSLVHSVPGIPYAGRLRLSATKLISGSSSLPAYRLAPAPHVGAFRSLLGIGSHFRRIVNRGVTWTVAADGGRAHRPLHSLAISLTTGELIYHDRRNGMLSHARAPLDRKDAISAARTWLTQLGFPGMRMPLRSFGNVRTMPKVRQVVLDWIGVGAAAINEATLWVTPNGSVIEAWVWPPVVQRGTVPARDVGEAWTAVRKGTVPLAVEGVSPTTTSSGVGNLQRTTVVSVLSSGADRRLYLVPTYRFEGTVRLEAAGGSHPWYGLAPGAQR
jgi:hypothetical protein